MISKKFEFSHLKRKSSIEAMKSQVFDLLVVGGGITGAAVARDAVGRGLRVALVERSDFASGTSSKSSKLIHGGLRYLENMEFKLVFEALSERRFLLKSAPHLVRPLKFYFPVYKGDPHGMFLMGLGMFLYDSLSMLRSPGYHKRLSSRQTMQEIPNLSTKGLKGAFSYFDAKMWDDLLAVETIVSASENGAEAANYVEAKEPVWDGDRVIGFHCKDRLSEEIFEIKAHSVVLCLGPWADVFGKQAFSNWRKWLKPSKGVHLVFDQKKLKLDGAVVMSHPTDGRISFAIPRPDYGSGVCIVGTTDGPFDGNPEDVQVTKDDVDYLMSLLNRYFPDTKLTSSDILSAYVGIRPLQGNSTNEMGSEAQSKDALQKVSREHSIEEGPGATTVVTGGKYTTHRAMAEEIVEFVLKKNKELANRAGLNRLKNSPVNESATEDKMDEARRWLKEKSLPVENALVNRYGMDACSIIEPGNRRKDESPPGFPFLEEQFRYSLKHEMTMRLEDFYLRRQPLFMALKDHGLEYAEKLGVIWGVEMQKSAEEVTAEVESLKKLFKKLESWRDSLESSNETRKSS